jgi:hypothetical protein
MFVFDLNYEDQAKGREFGKLSRALFSRDDKFRTDPETCACPKKGKIGQGPKNISGTLQFII